MAFLRSFAHSPYFLGCLAIFISPFAVASIDSQQANQLLLCYRDRLQEVSPDEKYNLALQGLPSSQLYSLYIDKKQLERLPLDFSDPHLLFDDLEPGYQKGMENGFRVMSKLIGQKTNLDLVIALHDAAVSGVVNKKKQSFKMGLGVAWQYKFETEKMSREARWELFFGRILFFPEMFPRMPGDTVLSLLIQGEIFRPYFVSSCKLIKGDHWIISHSNGIHADENKRIAFAFVNYEEKIRHAQSLKAKLAAISDLLRTLEIAHIFPDGNQRTYSFLLLNKLLIENNIPPAILDEPDMFDGFYSVHEMVLRLQKGILNYFLKTESYQLGLLDSSPCASKLIDLENNSYFSEDKSIQSGFSISNLLRELDELFHFEVLAAIQEDESISPAKPGGHF